MKKIILYTVLALSLALSGCNYKPRFRVSGHIANADKKVLYFELFGFDKTKMLDSMVLDKSGSFNFKTDLPDSPEFYRLSIGNRFIHLAADSSTKITIEADAKTFGEHYKVIGSKICENIRLLSDLQGKTVQQFNNLTTRLNNKELSVDDYDLELVNIFDTQREASRKIIYENPLSPAAYFALFQRIHNYLVFDPYNPEDNKFFAAVASSWDTFYPNSLRSKHLKLLTLQGMKKIRENKDLEKIEVKESANIPIFDITLSSIYGKRISLSSLIGKVVLLDFTAYKAESSAKRNLDLREIYRKYKDKGFEIYQISYDSDIQFWKNSASNLPWICVQDSKGSNSDNLRYYYIQTIPTYFLINREGEIAKRDDMIKDLNKEIQNLL